MAKKKSTTKKKTGGKQTASQKREQEIRATTRKKAKAKLAPPPAEPISPDELAKPAALPRGKQRQVKATAKKSRIKQASIESQIHGHMAARGRRKQAKRDSKG